MNTTNDRAMELAIRTSYTGIKSEDLLARARAIGNFLNESATASQSGAPRRPVFEVVLVPVRTG